MPQPSLRAFFDPVLGRVETDSLGYSLTSLREKGVGCLVFLGGAARGTGPDLMSSLYSRKETERGKKGDKDRTKER